MSIKTEDKDKDWRNLSCSISINRNRKPAYGIAARYEHSILWLCLKKREAMIVNMYNYLNAFNRGKE